MTYSNAFIKALEESDLEAIKKIPKTDLHNHSGMGMRFETFLKWAGEEVPYPPEKMDGIEGMDNYMEVTAPYVNSREGFEFLLTATLEEAARDGISILEASVDCSWISKYENPSDFFDFVKKAVQWYETYGEFRPEIGIFKGVPLEYASAVVTSFLESGIFKSIDFYGEEKYYQPEMTQIIMKMAKDKGLKTKIHIGEFSDAETIDQVYEFLKPDAIQHGINAFTDERLMGKLKDKRVCLNICPSSNVALGAVENINSHPIRALYDFGLTVSIATDDLLFFHRSVSEEYLWLYESGVFNAAELDEIRRMSLKACEL